MDGDLSERQEIVCAGKADQPINHWMGLRVAALLLLLIVLLSSGCRLIGANNEPAPRQVEIEETINTLLLDSRGWLWVGTSQGVIVIQPNNSKQKLYLQGKDGKALRVSAIALSGPEHVWLGTNDGVVRVNRELDIQEGVLEGQAVTALLSDGEDMLWIGTKSGLFEYQGQGVVVSVDLSKEGFRNTQVNALALDRNGKLYIGLESGLASYQPGQGSGIKIYRSISEMYHLPVKSLALDRQNRLWVGTSKGLARPVGAGVWQENHTKSGDSFGQVDLLSVDTAGRLWMNTQTDGLYVLDGSGRELDLDRPEELSGQVTALAVGQVGTIWVGTIWVAKPGKLVLFVPNAATGQPDRPSSDYWDLMKLILFWGLIVAAVIWWFIRINFRSNRRRRAMPEPTILREPATQPMTATPNLTARAESIDTLLATYRTGTPDERRQALEELEKRGQVEVF